MPVRWFVRLSALMIVTVYFAAAPAGGSELSGTSWQLVNITSMDDRVDVPDTPSNYTLQFNPDGTANILADCNRGSGGWSSEGAGQLQFGPVTSTRAMCMPGSLSGRYLAQFEWVRSYVFEGGHLYLATMADGSIIEFEPEPEPEPEKATVPVAAIVLGEAIRTDDAAEMQDAILTRLFDRYATEHHLSSEPAEVDAYVRSIKRSMAESGLATTDDLAPEEVAEIEVMRREMGSALIRQWKINKSLYKTYGGRVIYQQLGPEPLDAYRQYLQEREDAGDFTITNRSMTDQFWRYFRDDAMHDFMEPEGKEAARAFQIPPWGDVAVDKN